MGKIEEETTVSGSDIDKITTVRKFKRLMIDLFRGYPAWLYWGIIEGRFRGELGIKIVDILQHDELIEIDKTSKPIKYRLTPKGIDFAISMIHLEHSEKMLNYSEQMRIFTIAVIIIGGLTLVSGIFQLILLCLQNPIF